MVKLLWFCHTKMKQDDISTAHRIIPSISIELHCIVQCAGNASMCDMRRVGRMCKTPRMHKLSKFRAPHQLLFTMKSVLISAQTIESGPKCLIDYDEGKKIDAKCGRQTP